MNCSNLNYSICFVSTGNETEAIELLELGFNASTPDQYGRFAMHFAAEQGCKKYKNSLNVLILFINCMFACFLPFRLHKSSIEVDPNGLQRSNSQENCIQ